MLSTELRPIWRFCCAANIIRTFGPLANGYGTNNTLITMRLHTICTALALVSLTGCAGEEPPFDQLERAGWEQADEVPAASDAPAVENVARNYAQLHLITKEPVLVDPELAALCIGVQQFHVEDARKRTGPHAHTAVRIFMNDLAAHAFDKLQVTYPIGSVIVKEKQGLNIHNTLSGSSAKTRDGVGGMIKRAAGYDPAHGDWEYFYFEHPSQIEHGRIATCVECHRGAAATDFVFGDWAHRQ